MGFKTVFSLKQHTPMIHFQSGQEGATLRATELKPKFDKFLHTKIEGDFKKWLIGKGDHPAFDYKVRINTKNVELNQIGDRDRIPMYFGNMGDGERKSLSTTKENIEVVFNSFHTGLLELISQHFAEFLLITNFGTRQNKGYGSFFLDIEKHQIDQQIFTPYSSLNFSIRDWKDTFNVIAYYFQRLKSGVNFNSSRGDFNHYQHSFLKIYLNRSEAGYEWEKRWIKERFMDLEPSDKPKKFARAMLGLVGSYSFKAKRGDNPHNPNATRAVFPIRNLEINVTSDIIERFKSPITFKPIVERNNVRVFIIPNEIPKELTNQKFVFSANRNEHSIYTPSEVLDVKALLNAYHQHLGNSFQAYTFSGRPSYPVTIN